MSVIGSVVANLVANTRQFEGGMQRGARSVGQLASATQVAATQAARMDAVYAGFGKNLAKMAGMQGALKGFLVGGASGLAVGASLGLIEKALDKVSNAAERAGHRLGFVLAGGKDPEKAPPGFRNNLTRLRETQEDLNRSRTPKAISAFDAEREHLMRRFLTEKQVGAFEARRRAENSELASAELNRNAVATRHSAAAALVEQRKRTGGRGLHGHGGAQTVLDQLSRELSQADKRIENARAMMRTTDRSLAGDIGTQLVDRATANFPAFRTNLQQQAAAFGDNARRIGGLVGGVAASPFNGIRDAILEGFEKTRERRQAVEREVRSPFEVFEDRLKELQGLGLGGRDFGRALMAEKDRLKDALGIQEPQMAQAFEKGSVAAQAAINRANLQFAHQDPTLRELAEIAKEQQRVADELAKGIVVRELPDLQSARF